VRAFLAVPADPAWAESASRLVEKLRPACPRASWTRPGSWHLTLKFLGELSEGDADAFARELDAAGLSAVPAGDLDVRGAAAFPPRGRPRVLGIAFADSEALEALWRAAERSARAVGAPAERRPFHPHVTLARVRDPWPRSAIEAFRAGVEAWPFPAWHFTACVLFRSTLEPAGAVHNPLRTWPLSTASQEVRA
jgi:2'-5' RNA ligase